MCIRDRPAVRIHTLGDYVADGVMSQAQAMVLRAAVAERRNILVAGGTSSGKGGVGKSTTCLLYTSRCV